LSHLLFLSIHLINTVHTPIAIPNESPFSIIFITATSYTMYTVHPENVLLVRHPEPHTGPFKSIEVIDYSQCSCHPYPPEPDNDDGSVITSFSYSICPQRTSYDFTLSEDSTATPRISCSTCPPRNSYDLTLCEILPPTIKFVHPYEYSNLRSSDRPCRLRRLFANFGRRRRAKPMGQGVRLRAALSR